MLLLWYLEYVFWYKISHYHCVRSERILEKQKKEIYNPSTKRFRKLGFKIWNHTKRFLEIQVKLDALKEKICNKYPDLRDEA